MQALDIIHRAAVKSGVVPSYNPDEMPGEVEANGRQVLEQEVIVGINCDRTLDITNTARTFSCTNGKVVIRSLPLESKVITLGVLDVLESADLETLEGQLQALAEFDITSETSYPMDDLEDPLKVGVWTADDKFAIWTKFPTETELGTIDPRYNYRYPPMDIIAVFEDSNRVELQYLRRDEFESAEFFHRTDVYTTELYEDKLVILFHGKPNTPKRVVMPVPVTIENSKDDPNENSGVIHAPAKFEDYLTIQTAVGLAQMYGMSTLEVLSKIADRGYNRLQKNKPKSHTQNIRKQVAGYLGRAGGYKNEFI